MTKKGSTTSASANVRRITKHLRCDLSDAEKLGMGQELAREQAMLTVGEERKVEVVAAIKAEIAVHEAQVQHLSRTLNNGYEYRDVACEVVEDFDNKTVRTTRTDTGEEVDLRAMTPEEAQRPLPMGD
jgi:hypothetical protein